MVSSSGNIAGERVALKHARTAMIVEPQLSGLKKDQDAESHVHRGVVDQPDIAFGNLRSAMVRNVDMQELNGCKPFGYTRTAMVCSDENIDGGYKVPLDKPEVPFSSIRSSVLELDAECKSSGPKRSSQKRQENRGGQGSVVRSLTRRISDHLRGHPACSSMPLRA
jgi:hypothetical protein